jgi:hypothetical protein
VFFFEKKNQKTFINRVRCRRLRDSHPKVFCFFSSEKKAFFLIHCTRIPHKFAFALRTTSVFRWCGAGKTVLLAWVPLT